MSASNGVFEIVCKLIQTKQKQWPSSKPLPSSVPGGDNISLAQSCPPFTKSTPAHTHCLSSSILSTHPRTHCSPCHFHFLLTASVQESPPPSSHLLARRIMTTLGTLQQILFVDGSPLASLLGCLFCLDMLSLSDACSRASIGLPGIGGPR